MKIMIQFGSALMLWTLMAPPALADAFRVDMVCDSAVGLGQGQGKIDSQGTVKIHGQGLPENEPFTCAVDCTVVGDGVEQSCLSNAQGRLDVTFEEKLYVCLGAVFTIAQDATVLCASGFATLIPSPPHP